MSRSLLKSLLFILAAAIASACITNLIIKDAANKKAETGEIVNRNSGFNK